MDHFPVTKQDTASGEMSGGDTGTLCTVLDYFKILNKKITKTTKEEESGERTRGQRQQWSGRYLGKGCGRHSGTWSFWKQVDGQLPAA